MTQSKDGGSERGERSESSNSAQQSRIESALWIAIPVAFGVAVFVALALWG